MSKKSDAYEAKVHATFSQAVLGSPHIRVTSDTDGAGSNRHVPDLQFIAAGSTYNVEIKLNGKAQMGGSSIFFTGGTLKDRECGTFVAEVVQHKTNAVEKFRFALAELQQSNACLIGVPFSCERNHWNTLRTEGYLRDINHKIASNTQFLVDHYNRKGTFLMQIGGQGLFALGSNPLNLPIPFLENDMDLELRLGRSGSKPAANGTLMVSAGLRLQGRLKGTLQKSPYSLDKAEDIKELFNVKSGTTPIPDDQLFRSGRHIVLDGSQGLDIREWKASAVAVAGGVHHL